MMVNRSRRVSRLTVTVVLVAAACFMLPGLSAARSSSPLADVNVGGSLAAFQPRIDYREVRLTVSGPGGFQVVESFGAGETPAVELPGIDGLYKYELRFSPVLEHAERQRLEQARAAGGDLGSNAAADKLTVQRGSFSIWQGSLVPDDLTEEPAADRGRGQQTASVPGDPQGVVITNADGVIRNSACVGFDCPDAPAFGDSTILMMENNTRIKFGDTSNSPFPNNDWEIEANSANSGGASYLGFNDCGSADNDGGCATDLVFAVESGARASALYVESDGDIGIGTSNPVADIHVVTGNTPTLRLDQDGSSGFNPQVWDVAGNEANFFVRDVTNGSALSFRIRPGAPTSSIDVNGSGNVGIGTASPAASLHVRRTNATAQLLVEEATTTNGNRVLGKLSNFGPVTFEYEDTSNGNTWRINALAGGLAFNQTVGGNVAGAINEVVINEDGDIEAVGTITGGIAMPSSRKLKTGFEPANGGEILAKVLGLPISTWTYNRGLPTDGVPHLGPVAEDFYATFGLGEGGERIELVDTTGVALAAIQGLNEKLETAVHEKDAMIADLLQRLESLERAVGAGPALQ